MSRIKRPRQHRSTLRLAALVSAAALVATGLVSAGAVGANAAPAAQGFSGGSVRTQGQTTFTPGQYIVSLVDDAAANYVGGIRGMAPTKPDAGDQLNARRRTVQTYVDYLRQEQDAAAATVGATIDASYTLSLNGFSAELSAAQAAELAADTRVASVTKDELLHPTAAEPSTDFLGLSGDDGVWAATGGVDTAGEGVVLGVLDTGIAPENPSFAGDPLGTTASDAPYYSAPGVTSFAKSDGATFTGACETGLQFTVDDCSTKIVGARYFLAGYKAERIASPEEGEYPSPRDGDGHGSHTGSTAVGNHDVAANVDGQDFGLISGMAPAAKIASYKVCWTGKPPDNADGCTTTDVVSAVDAAIRDGVDAINYSIGGTPDDTLSPTDLAFLGAASAGVFVAASAGNSGPTPSTSDNNAPWVTSVAASTIPNWEATVQLGDGSSAVGASATVDRAVGATPVSGPLVNAAAVGVAGATNAERCVADTLDPQLTAGKIVVCTRGVNDRVAKSAEVARAGGIAVVLINPTPNSTDLDEHSLPTVHLDSEYYAPVTEYAATPGATATIVAGNATGVTTPTPQVVGFSSRGPVEAFGGDLLKPDISAPGAGILAAGANAAGAEPTWEFLSGTSMSSPHVAGLAVLYLGEKPKATPAEIKSAMMTTAYNTVDKQGNPVTDPFAQGAGHVDPTKFFDPGLLYLNGPADWNSFIEGLPDFDDPDPAVQPINPSALNLASISVGQLVGLESVTRTVTSTRAGTFTVAVNGLPGIATTVEPTTLTFGAAGETQSYTVTFERGDAPFDSYSTGSLDWASGDIVVHSPVAVRPIPIVAPADVTGEGVSGSVAIDVTPGSTGDIPLPTTGLTKGILQTDPTGTETEHSGSGVSGAVFEYQVVVPEGATYARFDLDALADGADLDLYVDLLDSAGEPVDSYSSATASGDERINLAEPEPGTYAVRVEVFEADPAATFDLVTYAVVPGGAPITLTPPVLPGVQGETTSFTASWTGLEPRSRYLGQIAYGDTGVSTALNVITGEPAAPDAPVNTAPPTITGTPRVGSTLTATPGEWDTSDLSFAYQWQANGVAIQGATGATYRVVRADEGKAITVVVTATAANRPTGTATSAPVTIVYASSTSLSLNRSVLFSWQRTTATVSVSTASDTPPTGTVQITANGKRVGSVAVAASADGKISYRLPKLGAGFYVIKAKFIPDDASIVAPSESPSKLVWVVF